MYLEQLIADNACSPVLVSPPTPLPLIYIIHNSMTGLLSREQYVLFKTIFTQSLPNNFAWRFLLIGMCVRA